MQKSVSTFLPLGKIYVTALRGGPSNLAIYLVNSPDLMVILTCLYYRPQTKFAKVMFLHLSVILFTGGVSRPTPRGGGVGPGGSRPTPKGGLGVWPGGVQAHTGGDVQAHTWGGGGVSQHAPQHMATAAGSTHPMGTHSC